MAADGSIKIKAELDKTAAEKAMSKFSSVAKAGFKAVTLSMTAIKGTMAGISLYAAKTGIEFESAFTGVRKTVDATENELQGFRNEIRDMSKDIPASAAAISGVAEAAGQLGIQNKNLMSFTRTMTDLGVATNMSAEEAATSMARFANITKMPQEKFSNLGSTVVALGNNLATTEREISEMGLRLAGAGAQVGMSEAKILGLAGALSSVGIEADAGGSAVSTVMAKMQLAAEHGGDALEQFASVAGMSASEFQQAFKEDAAQALVSFVTGLSTMEERGQSAIATLDDMEITEIRQRDALLRLSGAGDVLSKSLGIATQAWDDNNALTNEASQRYETLESRLQVLKNNVDDFAISIYDNMRDPLRDTVNESIDYIQRLHSAFNDGGVNAVVGELGNVFRDVTDDIAGTSDAAAGIVEPLQKIVSVGTTLGGAVLPVIGDGFEFTAKNMDVLIPTITAGVAAYKAFNAVGKITKDVTKANAVATAALNKMEKANALQLMATNGGLTARQSILAVHNGQITTTTALTGLWAKAQTGLNAAMAANPIGVAVAGTAALIGVGMAVSSVVNRQTEEEREHAKALRESAQAAKENLKSAQERKQSYEELVQSQNEQAAGDVAQLDRLASLNNELTTLVDANGRVKDGEEDRVAFITSQLSDALGMEISMTDHQISNYQELQSEIQNLIQQKRIDAVMTAQQAKYEEAVANQMQVAAEASANLTALKQAENDVKVESAELSQLEAEKNQAVLDGNKALVKKLDEKIKKQQEEVDSAKEALKSSQEAYQENTELLAQYANDIDMYTALAEAAATGNAEAIEAAISKITAGIKTANNATSEELQKQVIEVANTEALIKQEVEKGTAGFTTAMVEQAQGATTAALEEFAKVAPQTAEELNKVPPEAVAALIAGDMKGQLSTEASGAVDGMLDQFEELDGETQKAFANAVYGALEGLEGFDSISDPAEKGVEEFLETLKAALDEHSPSKKTEEIFRLAMEGAGNGVESGKEGVLSKAGEFITDFIGKFTEGGLGEKLQGVGADIMSFFGIGISSQNENSRAAGKANADAANEGAGSVNPTGNGALFGTLFGGGIGSTSEANKNAGNSIASSAEAGAGSVNPSGEGQTFGGQFAGGVGSKSGEAREEGSSLATNAKSGAGEADGYTPGSDFGAGFVRGIGAWLKDAASAAADLAISAYNSLRKALDERSPSRKTKKSGKNFDLGLSRGIEGNKKYAIKAAEELGNDTLEALDMSEVKEKMKGIDVSSVMDKVYMAFDDKKSRVADKMTSAVAVKENLAWKQRELSLSTKISDEDVEKIAVAFAKVASREMAKGMEGMGIYTNQREWGRLVREAVDR